MYKEYIQKNRFECFISRKSIVVQNSPNFLGKVWDEARKHIEAYHQIVQNAEMWEWGEIKEDLWI